jgi:4-aminobutyrate aminotransferase/(S)-3-amino-2-methylpropionate transaminase
VVAFEGSYHGLGYGPLAVSELRASYKTPFLSQLNPHVAFAPYPERKSKVGESLQVVADALKRGETGAILIEPILGRGGVVVPPAGTLTRLQSLAEEHGALLIADEIWTGLGRSGTMLECISQGSLPHLVCLGKGLGGGLPISACIGRLEVMQSWSRAEEVVHTSTFAGAPLTCATSLALLDVLRREDLPERALNVGGRWLSQLRESLAGQPLVGEVRGKGFMIGIELSPRLRNGAVALQRALLERGYITSTGGGKRDVLILTPALNIAQSLLDDFTSKLGDSLRLIG